MMAFILALALGIQALAHARITVPSVQPLWRIDLRKTYGYRNFERAWFPMWQRQGGLAFVSPEILAVYQVIESKEPVPLGPRNRSGGAGNYSLQIS